MPVVLHCPVDGLYNLASEVSYGTQAISTSPFEGNVAVWLERASDMLPVTLHFVCSRVIQFSPSKIARCTFTTDHQHLPVRTQRKVVPCTRRVQATRFVQTPDV